LSAIGDILYSPSKWALTASLARDYGTCYCFQNARRSKRLLRTPCDFDEWFL